MFILCINVSETTICRYKYGRMLTVVLKAPGICHRAHRPQGTMPTVAMAMPGICHRAHRPQGTMPTVAMVMPGTCRDGQHPDGRTLVVALEAPKDTPYACGTQHVTLHILGWNVLLIELLVSE